MTELPTSEPKKNRNSNMTQLLEKEADFNDFLAIHNNDKNGLEAWSTFDQMILLILSKDQIGDKILTYCRKCNMVFRAAADSRHYNQHNKVDPVGQHLYGLKRFWGQSGESSASRCMVYKELFRSTALHAPANSGESLEIVLPCYNTSLVRKDKRHICALGQSGQLAPPEPQNLKTRPPKVPAEIHHPEAADKPIWYPSSLQRLLEIVADNKDQQLSQLNEDGVDDLLACMSRNISVTSAKASKLDLTEDKTLAVGGPSGTTSIVRPGHLIAEVDEVQLRKDLRKLGVTGEDFLAVRKLLVRPGLLGDINDLIVALSFLANWHELPPTVIAKLIRPNFKAKSSPQEVLKSRSPSHTSSSNPADQPVVAKIEEESTNLLYELMNRHRATSSVLAPTAPTPVQPPLAESSSTATKRTIKLPTSLQPKSTDGTKSQLPPKASTRQTTQAPRPTMLNKREPARDDSQASANQHPLQPQQAPRRRGPPAQGLISSSPSGASDTSDPKKNMARRTVPLTVPDPPRDSFSHWMNPDNDNSVERKLDLSRKFFGGT